MVVYKVVALCFVLFKLDLHQRSNRVKHRSRSFARSVESNEKLWRRLHNDQHRHRQSKGNTENERLN